MEHEKYHMQCPPFPYIVSGDLNEIVNYAATRYWFTFFCLSAGREASLHSTNLASFGFVLEEEGVEEHRCADQRRLLVDGGIRGEVHLERIGVGEGFDHHRLGLFQDLADIRRILPVLRVRVRR